MDDAPVRLRISCLDIRHKQMYVDERQGVMGMIDDSSDTRIFFCVRTQEALGPDGRAVTPRACASGRSCYRAGG